MLFPTTVAISRENAGVCRADSTEDAIESCSTGCEEQEQSWPSTALLGPAVCDNMYVGMGPTWDLSSYAKTVVRPMMMQLKATHGLNLSPVQWE